MSYRLTRDRLLSPRDLTQPEVTTQVKAVAQKKLQIYQDLKNLPSTSFLEFFHFSSILENFGTDHH